MYLSWSYRQGDGALRARNQNYGDSVTPHPLQHNRGEGGEGSEAPSDLPPLVPRVAWHLCPPLPTPCASTAVEFPESQGKQVNVPFQLPTVVLCVLWAVKVVQHSSPKPPQGGLESQTGSGVFQKPYHRSRT